MFAVIDVADDAMGHHALSDAHLFDEPERKLKGLVHVEGGNGIIPFLYKYLRNIGKGIYFCYFRFVIAGSPLHEVPVCHGRKIHNVLPFGMGEDVFPETAMFQEIERTPFKAGFGLALRVDPYPEIGVLLCFLCN